MGLKGKLIAEVELISSADQYHHQVRHQPQHISTFSDIIDSCDLHSGNFGDHGSTIFLSYTQLDGKAVTAKMLVEVIEENKKTRFTVIGGSLIDNFKSFVINLETITREADPDLLKWTLDYEKLAEDGPHPVETLDAILNVSRHIEVEHAKSN